MKIIEMMYDDLVKLDLAGGETHEEVYLPYCSRPSGLQTKENTRPKRSGVKKRTKQSAVLFLPYTANKIQGDETGSKALYEVPTAVQLLAEKTQLKI